MKLSLSFQPKQPPKFLGPFLPLPPLTVLWYNAAQRGARCIHCRFSVYLEPKDEKEMVFMVVKD